MKQNISIVRGRTQTFNIAVTDANGEAYTLESEEKLIFGVKKNYYDVSYLIEKKLTSANATTDAGVYALKILPEDTKDLACGEYCYDVGLQSGSDYYSVIECSHFKVEHNVTGKEATT